MKRRVSEERISEPDTKTVGFFKRFWHPTFDNRYQLLLGKTQIHWLSLLYYTLFWAFSAGMMIATLTMAREIYGSVSHFFLPLAILALLYTIYRNTHYLCDIKNTDGTKPYWAAQLGYFIGYTSFATIFYIAEEFFFEGLIYQFYYYVTWPFAFFMWLLTLNIFNKFNTQSKIGHKYIGLLSVASFIVCFLYGVSIVVLMDWFILNYPEKRLDGMFLFALPIHSVLTLISNMIILALIWVFQIVLKNRANRSIVN